MLKIEFFGARIVKTESVKIDGLKEYFRGIVLNYSGNYDEESGIREYEFNINGAPVILTYSRAGKYGAKFDGRFHSPYYTLPEIAQIILQLPEIKKEKEEEMIDYTAAREIALELENNGLFYANRIQYVIRSLARKRVSGVYNSKLALRAWCSIAQDWRRYCDPITATIPPLKKGLLQVIALELAESSEEEIQGEVKRLTLKSEWPLSAIRKHSLAAGDQFFKTHKLADCKALYEFDGITLITEGARFKFDTQSYKVTPLS